MENGFFGKQLLNENIAENVKVRIFQTFYNFWQKNEWILVDGIPGKNTLNAINEVKKLSPWKEAFLKGFDDGLKSFYLNKLNEIKDRPVLISDIKSFRSIHDIRALQAILHLCGSTGVIPDGVVGTKTKAAMRERLGTDVIANVTDEKLKEIIDLAIDNVDTNNMSFKIAGVEDAAGAGGTGDATTGGTSTTADAKTSLFGGTSVDLKGLKEWLLKNKVLKGAIGTVRDQSTDKRTLRVSSDNTKDTVDINSDLLDNYEGIADFFRYSPEAGNFILYDKDGKVLLKKSLKDVAIDPKIAEMQKDAVQAEANKNMLFNSLTEMKSKVKSYWHPYGTFKFKRVDTEEFSTYEVLDKNGNFITQIYGTTESFKSFENKLNFNSNGGCWRYFSEKNRISLFRCGDSKDKYHNNDRSWDSFNRNYENYYY